MGKWNSTNSAWVFPLWDGSGWMKLVGFVFALIHIHQYFTLQDERYLCKSKATYKCSGDIFSRGVLLGVHIIAIFMDANSLRTKPKLFFFHNAFVPNRVLQSAQILFSKKCLWQYSFHSEEMDVSDASKRSLLMYCAVSVCQCNCSSIALPIELSQAWIPSLSTLTLLGSTEGQLHPLGVVELIRSGLWLVFKGSTVHCCAPCSIAVLLLPVEKELSG